MQEHPESYPARADMRLGITGLRDQIAAPARPILLVLLAAAAVVFIIACSNVANLILARSVRREGELAVRAALGASRGALRRTLLAESLVLCGAGAVLGVLLARPMVSIVARFAARFSVRALEVTVDSSLLWVGAGLAMAAAVLLAYVPKLPSASAEVPAKRWRTREPWRRRTDRVRPDERQPAHHARHQSALARVRHHAGCVLVRAAGRRRDVAGDADRVTNCAHRLRHAAGAGDRFADADIGRRHRGGPRLLSGSDAPDWRAPRCGRRLDRQFCTVARQGEVGR